MKSLKGGPMAYPINIEHSNELYHVTFKTQHDRFSLVIEEDIQTLGAYMNEYKHKHKIKIFAFSIMSNHVHLLLKNSTHEHQAIKHFIRDVKREYAKHHNIRYGSKGHFWARSYRQKHIDGDIQLLNTVVYILNNPVDAYLCKQPENFANSSFHLLLNKNEIRTFNKNNQFLNKKELHAIYAKAKQQRYAQGLPAEEQAKRGLSDFIDAKKFKNEIKQGRKQYKTQGPWLHYFPKNKSLVNQRKKYISLALTDCMPETYRPQVQLLKKLCQEQIIKSKQNKQFNKQNSQFKTKNSNTLYEAKTKKGCQQFQQQHAEQLPINALAKSSVVKTTNGWALIALIGRPRKKA